MDASKKLGNNLSLTHRRNEIQLWSPTQTDLVLWYITKARLYVKHFAFFLNQKFCIFFISCFFLMSVSALLVTFIIFLRHTSYQEIECCLLTQYKCG